MRFQGLRTALCSICLGPEASPAPASRGHVGPCLSILNLMDSLTLCAACIPRPESMAAILRFVLSVPIRPGWQFLLMQRSPKPVRSSVDVQEMQTGRFSTVPYRISVSVFLASAEMADCIHGHKPNLSSRFFSPTVISPQTQRCLSTFCNMDRL